MHLNSLSLVNFKNISQVEMALSERVNCFIGDNGQGKTNLLDAIYHLGYTKSFFNSIDSQNIKFDESFYVIQGKVEKLGTIVTVYKLHYENNMQIPEKIESVLFDYLLKCCFGSSESWKFREYGDLVAFMLNLFEKNDRNLAN